MHTKRTGKFIKEDSSGSGTFASWPPHKVIIFLFPISVLQK